MSLQDNRREYDYGKLSRESLLDDPFTQFNLWMAQALESGIVDPTAMSVATVDSDGKPWQRMVLLKGLDERGFVFYTNFGSRKATDIMSNPQVSLQFPWLQLDRQVIVGGMAELLSDKEVRLFSESTNIKPTRRLGVKAKQPYRLTRGAGSPVRSRATTFWLLRDSFARVLGWL